MDKDKLEYFKNLLLQRKKELENHLSEIEGTVRISQQDSSGDISSYRTHPADVSSDTESREISSFIVSSVVDRLKKINESIERIEDGIYGICELCGKEIEFDRLKAIPYTTVCIECGKKL